MVHEELPTGRVALLFTDIESSTRLLAVLGDRFGDLVADHRTLLSEAIERHGGIDVGSGGDAQHALFTDPHAAVRAAIDAQRALAAHPWPDGLEIRVRMGVHVGDVGFTRGEYFGMGFHGAARVSDAAHGGQIVLSEAAVNEIDPGSIEGLSFQDLGPHALKDLGERRALYQVVHVDLERSFPPLRTLSVLANNLPVELSSFVGRQREMADVTGLLREHRLMTLVGPGGTGKTRLSLQVAAEIVEEFPEGVWFVELASTDPDGVVRAVADAMGIRDEPGRPLVESIVERCRAKRTLILLDNCEHVIDACAVLADAIVKGTRNVAVLATSREPLGVRGEWVYELLPLDVPSEGATTAEEVNDFDAARLYIARAAASGSWLITDDDALYLARVCRLLDGLPLAIEIAAARAGVVTPRQLCERLEDRLQLEHESVHRRQRSLWALIDWSHELLDDREKELFRRLAVFPANFGLESASDVCGSGADVLPVLSRLVWRSLVAMDRHGADVRYRMLETIREYAGTKASEAADLPDVRDRYRIHFVALAKRLSGDLDVGDQREVLTSFGVDAPHFRATLSTALEDGDPDTAAELVAACSAFWRMRGHFREAVDTAQRVAHILPADSPRRAAVLKVWGTSLYWLGGDGVPLLEEAVASAEGAGLDAVLSSALVSLGVALEASGELDRAQEIYERAQRMTAELGNHREEAAIVGNLGIIELRRGDLAGAEELMLRSRDLAESAGDSHVAANALANLSYIAASRYDYKLALERAEAAVAIGRDLDAASLCVYLGNAAFAAREVGSGDLAESYQLEGLDVARRAGLVNDEAGALQNLAVFCADREDLDGAERWYREMLATAIDAGLESREVKARLAIASVALVRGDLEHAATDTDQALALARRIGSPPYEAEALGYLGRIALERGDTALAKTLGLQAHQIATDQEDDFELARAAEVLARISEAAGSVDEASFRWNELLEVTDRMGGGRSGRPLAHLAVIALDEGRVDDARSLSQRALIDALSGSVLGVIGEVLDHLAVVAERTDGHSKADDLRRASDRLKAGDGSVLRELREGAMMPSGSEGTDGNSADQRF